MPGLPRASRRRRRRPGSVDRPLNGRLYRLTLLAALLPALGISFAVSHPDPLPAAPPPAFDTASAFVLAEDLARTHPNRAPGTDGAAGAADWVAAELERYGYEVQRDRFRAEIPGRGSTNLENLMASARGRSAAAIVVIAHRDNLGAGPGANVNASGTAALLELARIYGRATAEAGGGAVRPTHTIVFVSTDGGAFGGLGAVRLLERQSLRRRTLAVVNLVGLAGRKRARIDIAGESSRSPSAAMVATAAARIRDQTGRDPRRTGVVGQLVDLAFPFSLYEHAPFIGVGLPALTVTTADARPPEPFGDSPERLSAVRFAQLGASAQALVDSLDQGLELAEGPASFVYLGSRTATGWAIQLALLAAVAPFLIVLGDFLLRCRRRGVEFLPGLRSLVRRTGFWLFAVAVFFLFDAAGLWTEGASRPISPYTQVAHDWDVTVVLAFATVLGAGWVISRRRLAPRASLSAEDELAGYAAALVLLAAVAVTVGVTNPYALLFVLPSLHAWLWLPQLRIVPSGVRVAVLLVGLAGPLILLGSLAIRFGLGLDAPWYLAQLASVGYVSTGPVLVTALWLAAGAQLAALATRRYSPYPTRAERRRYGMRPALSRVVRPRGTMRVSR